MNFIESAAFTKRVFDLLDEESYIGLQVALIQCSEAGDLIVHGGGLRKIRWSAPCRGKRGGVRVIYYYRSAQDIINLAEIYAQN